MLALTLADMIAGFLEFSQVIYIVEAEKAKYANLGDTSSSLRGKNTTPPVILMLLYRSSAPTLNVGFLSKFMPMAGIH